MGHHTQSNLQLGRAYKIANPLVVARALRDSLRIVALHTGVVNAPAEVNRLLVLSLVLLLYLVVQFTFD